GFPDAVPLGAEENLQALSGNWLRGCLTALFEESNRSPELGRRRCGEHSPRNRGYEDGRRRRKKGPSRALRWGGPPATRPCPGLAWSARRLQQLCLQPTGPRRMIERRQARPAASTRGEDMDEAATTWIAPYCAAYQGPDSAPGVWVQVLNPADPFTEAAQVTVRFYQNFSTEPLG